MRPAPTRPPPRPQPAGAHSSSQSASQQSASSSRREASLSVRWTPRTSSLRARTAWDPTRSRSTEPHRPRGSKNRRWRPTGRSPSRTDRRPACSPAMSCSRCHSMRLTFRSPASRAGVSSPTGRVPACKISQMPSAHQPLPRSGQPASSKKGNYAVIGDGPRVCARRTHPRRPRAQRRTTRHPARIPGAE